MPRSWYLTFDERQAARVRLYCLPFAGGGASLFRHWHRHLPSWVELRAVRLPGRLELHREPPFADCEEAAESLAGSLHDELAAEDAGRPVPYALFGHSMGAMIAYRLTRLLQRRNATLPVLFACASWPVRGVPTQSMPDPGDPDGQFTAVLKAIGGIPAEVLEDPELLALSLPVMRADFRLCRSYVYQPEPPLPIPVAAFGGVDDAVARPESLAEWREHTEDYQGLRLFAGGHFFLRDEVPALTASVTACLDKVLSKPGDP